MFLRHMECLISLSCLLIQFNIHLASFGELSFNADGLHSRRNAGVISDGNHGQTRVQVQTGIFNTDGMNKVETSNVAILLLVPEYSYMSEMFARDSSKHQTKDKVSTDKGFITRPPTHWFYGYFSLLD